jgi:hypothetical protein
MTGYRMADVALENAAKDYRALEESLRTRSAIEDSIRGSNAHLEDAAARIIARDHVRMKQLHNALGLHISTAAQSAMDSYARSSADVIGTLERAALENSLRFASGWLVQEDLASKAFAKTIELERSISAVPPAQIGGGLAHLNRFADLTPNIAMMIGRIESQTLGALIPSLAMDRAWDSVRQMAIIADLTWTKFVNEPARLAALSPSLARAPALEIYAAARGATLLAPVQDPDLLEVIEEAELGIVRIEDAFEARLEDFDAALVRMYQGALQRIDQGGIDWQRQALISFRELLMHTLHKLAPDEEVRSWARPDHFSNDKLTRLARVEFIFRDDNNGDLVPFMKKDFSATVELLGLLNKVHKKDPGISRKQFRILKNRIQCVISTFLEAAGH